MEVLIMDMLTEKDRDRVRNEWSYRTTLPDVIRDVLKEAFDEGKILPHMPRNGVSGKDLYKMFMKGEIRTTDEMREEISVRMKEVILSGRLFREDISIVKGTP